MKMVFKVSGDTPLSRSIFGDGFKSMTVEVSEDVGALKLLLAMVPRGMVKKHLQDALRSSVVCVSAEVDDMPQSHVDMLCSEIEQSLEDAVIVIEDVVF